jgi:hypothetical protein
MRTLNSLANQVGNIFMSHNPYFFYREVIFFNLEIPEKTDSSLLSFYEIFVQQVDIKLLEEQSEEEYQRSRACFFFKS